MSEDVWVPILPDMREFMRETSAGAKKAGDQAGRDFASSMERNVKRAQKAVDTAASANERAANRATDATAKRRLEEQKLNETLEKGTATTSQIMKATQQYEKAQREEAAALRMSEKANDNLSKAKRELTKASDEASDSVSLGADELDDFGSSADGLLGKIGNLAAGLGGLAGVAGLAGFAALGKDVAGEIGNINRQLGYTGAEASNVADQVGIALRSGVATGAEDAAQAVGSLEAQFDNLGQGGEKTAGELADKFLAFTRTFEVDMAEATQTAGQLVLNGLAPDVTSAADLMTAAMQRIPAQMRDELPEIINEYGVHFAGLGLSGEEAFSMLVSAADRGKWALDKTGDALKEFQIRGSDMSKASVDAYESIGLNAEEMSNKIASGGDQAREVLEATAKGLLGIQDPAERANQAVALFGTPIEDLSIDQIPQFLEALTGMEDHMSGAEGASQALADSMANSLDGRLNALKGTVQDLAGNAFMWLWDVVSQDLIPAFREAGDWIQRNSAWLAPLAVAVGSAAVALGGLAAAHQVQAMWASRAAFSTTMLGRALTFLLAHPIVAAIAAIAGALIYFFTQTETGKKTWESMTSALVDGWNWVSDKVGSGIDWITEKWSQFTDWISTAWSGITSLFQGDFTSDLRDAYGIEEDHPVIRGFFFLRDTAIRVGEIISSVWSGIVKAGQIAAAIIGTLVIAPILIGWNALSDGIAWAWENLIKPAWDLMTAAASFMWTNVLQPVFGFVSAAWSVLANAVMWYWTTVISVAWTALQAAANFMWNSVLMPVFNAIQAGWNLLATGIQWYWQNVIMVVWSALQAAANFMWTNVLMPIFGFIQDRWAQLAAGIQWAYDTIIKPTWDALGAALRWLYDTVIQPVLAWVGDRWNDMANILEAGKQFIVDSVFGGLQRGLDVVKSAFELARDAIGAAWDGIKAKAATPVKFVIQRVFNDGIVEAWNKVAGWVGLDPIEKYEPDWLGAYNTGGIVNQVPGYSPGRDDHVFIEPKTGTAIALSGGEPVLRPEAGRALGSDWVDGINAAARVGGVSGVNKFLGSYNTGGVVPSITGLVDRYFPGMTITSTYRNTNDHHGSGLAVDFSNGTDSTPQMRAAAQFFYKNYGPALLELIHSPFGNNVKNGQNVGDGFGFYGSGTMNQHRNHVHVAAAAPLPEPGDPITPVPSGGVAGGVVNWLRNRVADALDGVFSPIANAIPTGDGIIGGLPRAAFEKMTGAVTDFIRGKADESGAYHGDVGAGVEKWRGLVERLLETKGYPVSLADTVLRRMDQESTGDPRAINNWDDNAKAGWPTKGLMQMRDDTFMSHADPGYTDIWDPESNIRSSFNYTTKTYGSLPAGYNRAGGYHDGGLAGWGTGVMRKTAIEPEFVLNPKATEAFVDWLSGTPQAESAAVIAREIREAFHGGDWGYGELGSYIGHDNARRLLEEISWLGGAIHELEAAWLGGDWGVASVARYLGGNEEIARQLLDAVEALGEGTRAATAVWLEEAPTQDDWITAGLDFFGVGDSLTVGLVRKGMDFQARVAEIEAELAEVDDTTIADPVIVDTPTVTSPVATEVDTPTGVATTAAGSGEGVTVVVNLDGVEILRERVDQVEDDVVEIDAEIKGMKRERRPVGTDGALLS